MIKIKSLFQRNYGGDGLLRNEVTPGSEWVQNGEGYATRKWDGKAVLIKDGEIYVRFDFKPGRTKPEGFEPCTPEPDPQSGHWPGWVPETGKNLLRIAVLTEGLPDGTYEFCGPTVGTRHGPNPEKLQEHILVPHGKDLLVDVPVNFDGLKKYLEGNQIEGIVWYHPDGRMVKIKVSDFGIRR